MDSTTFVNNYEQAIPMWDEAEKKQTVKKVSHKIETVTKVPKVGVMLVGLGGNNGSTFVAGILANKKKTSWETKNGIQHPNFHGSFTQSATAHVGFKFDEEKNKLEGEIHRLVTTRDPKFTNFVEVRTRTASQAIS